ncbi:PRM1 [Candida pseudojiufengensis]|uniref:PRM1 n=1 Tax=Candida pseudojiufengensis TaxID=497109 RepID=UPI0022254478|nr:PRM1 [Candida pseudojiufengensis]KAI5964597.1 PRM1 [Candida pseudojiufengensis]
MIRNYLNFTEVSTQIYLNQYTILLFLILVKLILLRNSLINTISKQVIDTSICDEDNIQPLLNGIHNMIIENLTKLKYTGIVFIILIIKTIKALTIFYIDILLGTYICLLNAIVKGTTEVAFDTGETVIRTVNVTIVEATNEIEEGLQGLSKFINDLVTGFNAIKSFFTNGKSADEGKKYEQKINITLGNLKDKIAIPGTVLEKIDNAKNISMKGINDLNNETQTLIDTPFNLIIKKLDNVKLSNSSANITIEPINVRSSCLKTVDEVQDTQDKLVKLVKIVSKYLFIGMILIIIGSIAYALYIESRRWKRSTNFIRDTDQTNEIGFRNQHNIYNNAILYTIIKKMGFNLNSKVIWSISYMTNKFTLNVLMFGLLGILTVILQYILIKYVSSEISNQMKEIDKKQIVSNITSNYIKSMNNYINTTEINLNEELFGEIKETSTKINNTISEFVDNLDFAISEIFGKSFIYDAINTVVYCTIGRKLEKIEKGCNWLNENLKINLPLISKNLEKDIKNIKFLNSNYYLKKLKSIIEFYYKSLKIELIINLCFLLCWILQFIIGLLILFFKQSKSDIENINLKIFRISSPKPLNEKQKKEYQYPLSDPLLIKNFPQTSSSVYPV